MTRLLIVTTNFPRWEGDPHSPWLVELLRFLRQQGVVVDILAPAYAGLGNHVIEGMPVHRFRYAPAAWETMTHEEGAPNKIRKNPLYLFLLIPYLLAGLLAAWRLGRKDDYDIVHVHWPMPQGLLGLAARRRGRRLVATFYGADLVLTRRFPFLQGFLTRFVRQCDDVAAISNYTASELERLTGLQAHVIPYGISVPILDQAPPAEPGLILTVGRLIARKGQAYLIEALSLLRDRSDAHLVIVGEGHERPALEALISRLDLAGRVTLTGRVPDEALQEWYRRCQVFVLPSIVDETGDTEMLGMVLLEAMRYRKPVIATAVGGIADIVTDGESGLLVAQRDPAALAAAIAAVCSDPALAERLSDAGYAAARNQFSWDHVVAETWSLYGRPAAP